MDDLGRQRELDTILNVSEPATSSAKFSIQLSGGF